MLDTNIKMTSIIIHVILSRLSLYDEVFSSLLFKDNKGSHASQYGIGGRMVKTNSKVGNGGSLKN